jgi:hypothetical protein
MSGTWMRARNPLLIDGTALPPTTLLVAKVLVVVFFASGQLDLLPSHFNPFIAALDHAGSPAFFRHTLQIVAVVAGVALLGNIRVRTAAGLFAVVLLAGILSSRPYYQNNTAYVACLFVLIALSSRDERRPLVQYQVILLYIAAALNKTLAGDWENGDFFSTWAALSPQWHGEYHALTSVFSSGVVAIALSWIAIVTEWLLVAGFIVRRLHPLAIWTAIAYHTGLFLFTSRTFGMFWFALLASFMTFARWPAGTVVVTAPRDLLGRVAAGVARLDPEHRLEVRRTDGPGRLRLAIGAREHRGLDGLVRMLLCLPATYLAFALVSAAFSGRWAALIVMAFLAQYAYSSLRGLRAARAAPAPA